MTQQQAQHPRPDASAAAWFGPRRTALVVAVAVLAALAVGYVVGQRRPALHRAQVACLSAEQVISCGDPETPNQADYWVPTDVGWTDSGGSFHDHGRPACLPPVGIGTVTVTVTWMEIAFDGVSRQQVVGVEC